MAKTVLVIVDEQVDFTSGALGNKECEATVQAVVGVVNNGSYSKIYLTRDTHHDNYLETEEGRNLPIPHCFKDSSGWQIRSEIMDAVRDKNYFIIDKPTFGSVKLAERLHNEYKSGRGTEITLVGVCTGICIISNALLLKAMLPEAKITVKASACACVTPESHKTALEAMKMCHINIEED